MPCDTASAPVTTRPVILAHVPAGGAPGLLLAPHTYLGRDLWLRYAAHTGALKFTDQTSDGGRKGQLGGLEQAARAVAKLQADGFEVRAADAATAARLVEGAAAAGSVARDADAHLAQRVVELAARGLVPRPYQLVGIRWLRATKAGALLDEMGLGKTMQVLLAMGDRGVVFCPASVKGVWAREAGMWRPDLRATILDGKGALRWPNAGELVIVNYDVVSENDVAEIGPAPEGTDLAIDEGHVVKNARTNRARAVRAVAKAVEQAAGRRWIVTATPICNRPMELKAVLDAVGAFGTAFSSYSAFSRAFGGAVRSPRAEPTDAAGPALARVSLRRLKSDVAKDLPSKTIVRVPVQIDARSLALAAEIETKIRPAVEAAEAQAAMESLAAQESEAAALARRVAAISRAFGEAENIGEMSRFKRTISEAKVPHMLEMVEAREDAGLATVVATCHREVVAATCKRGGWSAIVGGVANDERTRIVDAFQGGAGHGVALTVRAGGVGITLTRADAMIFVDRDWNPAMNEQCEDRLHRIGQVQSVTIYVLDAGTWIEERVEELNRDKRRMIAATMASVTTEGGQVPEAPVLAEIAVGAPVPVPGAAPSLPTGWTADADLVARVATLAAAGVDGVTVPGIVGFLTKVLGERGGLPGTVRGEAITRVIETAEKQVAKQRARLAPRQEDRPAEARDAATGEERFAAHAMTQLAGMDGDRAQRRNEMGFDKADGAKGHGIAAAWSCTGRLTDDEFAWAAKKAVKYRRQVGTFVSAIAGEDIDYLDRACIKLAHDAARDSV